MLAPLGGCRESEAHRAVEDRGKRLKNRIAIAGVSHFGLDQERNRVGPVPNGHVDLGRRLLTQNSSSILVNGQSAMQETRTSWN